MITKSFHFIEVIFIMGLYGKKLNIKKPNGVIQTAIYIQIK